MKELFCLRVDRLSVSYGEQELVFWTNEGPVVYGLEWEGDSETWFCNVVGTDNLLGEVVTAVDADGIALGNFTLPHSSRSQHNGDYDYTYCYTLTTPKGVTTIEYRNTSGGPFNGPCGGTLSPPSFTPPEPALLRDITQDWHA